MTTFRGYFFRWLRGPVNIAQGLVQTLSLGAIDPLWSLWAEGMFLDACTVKREVLDREG